MQFDVVNPGPPVDRQRLSLYCTENSLVLPESLRSQLVDQNGGSPCADLFIRVGGDYEELMSFFGVDMPNRATELAWNANVFRGRVPGATCPFANDPGGNLFLIETLDAADGAIWFWDHEREGDPGAAVEIAASLGEFLNSLTPANEIDA